MQKYIINKIFFSTLLWLYYLLKKNTDNENHESRMCKKKINLASLWFCYLFKNITDYENYAIQLFRNWKTIPNISECIT